MFFIFNIHLFIMNKKNNQFLTEFRDNYSDGIMGFRTLVLLGY